MKKINTHHSFRSTHNRHRSNRNQGTYGNIRFLFYQTVNLSSEKNEKYSHTKPFPFVGIKKFDQSSFIFVLIKESKISQKTKRQHNLCIDRNLFSSTMDILFFYQGPYQIYCHTHKITYYNAISDIGKAGTMSYKSSGQCRLNSDYCKYSQQKCGSKIGQNIIITFH